MGRIYALLKIVALLLAAIAAIGMGFPVLFAIRDQCASVASIEVCKIAYAGASGFFIFLVAYFSIVMMAKFRKELNNNPLPPSG